MATVGCSLFNDCAAVNIGDFANGWKKPKTGKLFFEKLN
jgi:hypothetical protein